MTERKFDVRVRKALCIYGVVFLRVENAMRQKRLAELIGVQQKTISVWESDSESNANNCPNFAMLLKICKALGVSLDILCEVTINRIEGNCGSYRDIAEYLRKYVGMDVRPQYDEDEETCDFSSAHKIRLQRYENIEFYGYYYHTNRSTQVISQMEIKTGNIMPSGFIKVQINCDQNTNYNGKIISPANQSYTYIYFKRMDDFPERCIIILPHPLGIGETYMGGIGCMLSLSKGEKKVPTLQKIAIINKALGLELEGDFIHASLLISLDTLKDGKVKLADFRKSNSEFICKIKEMLKKQ